MELVVDGERDTDDIVQKLLFVVLARLVAVPDGGARFR